MRYTWKDYIQNSLISSGYVVNAAIIGVQKNQRYGISTDFAISPQETKSIIHGFTDPEALNAHGIMLGGHNYTCVRNDNTTILGKKTPGGCCVIKTLNLLIITVYEDPIHAVNCLNLTARLADYFSVNGF